MPLYEYECGSCGGRFERIQKFSDPPVTDCPTCGGRVQKLLSSPAIQFKGSGFYITDYARSGQPAEPGTAAGGGEKPAGEKPAKDGDAARPGAPATAKSDSPATAAKANAGPKAESSKTAGKTGS